jgi:hypothetical protein
VDAAGSTVLAVGEPSRLGAQASRLRFGEDAKQEGSWAGRRLLWLDDEPAFELSYWCGTCPFLFQRLSGSNETVSIAKLERELAEGLDGLDASIIRAFSQLLPEGEYVPLLLAVQPRLVQPLEPGDYFSSEQVLTWGIDSFWGLPAYPQTPYYRTFETPVDDGAHLFEFIVPMVPPSWNEPARVAEHRERLQTSARPTAVSVSILDVCEPSVEADGTELFAHWCVAHVLLDGHHKLQAAAESERRLQLLSLLSVNGGLSSAEQVARLPHLRRQAASDRRTAA